MVAHGDRAGPTGQELLAEFQEFGHQQPFEEIVRRYAGMVFNVCLRVTKDKHDAEDATQAVFLTLALQAKRGTEIKALGPWLQQVGKRLSLDSRRSKKRRKNREERHHQEQTHRIDSMLTDRMPEPDMDELKVILNEELQKLPTKYRLPLILHYYGGMSRDEMATELNCKASTLGVRIFRGREMLAGRLSGRGVSITAGALAVAMSYAIKHAIAEGLITSTSHTAVAVAAGHSGVGLASASVLGLTRHAGSALSAGRVKMLVTAMVLATTSLGATAQAIGLLPQINVQKAISESVRRMVQPLFKPVTRSLIKSVRADAGSGVSKQTPISQPTAIATPLIRIASRSTVGTSANLMTQTVSTPAVQNDPSTSTMVAASAGGGGYSYATPSRSIIPMPIVTSDPAREPTRPDSAANTMFSAFGSSPTVSDGGNGSMSPLDTSGSHPNTDSRSSGLSISVPVVVTAQANTVYVPVVSKSLDEIAAANRRIVAAGPSVTGLGPVTYNSSSLSLPGSQVVNVLVVNGVATESDGILRGYGSVTQTGTLTNDGAVVADGFGVDRTFDFKTCTNLTTTAVPGSISGWYAADKGRLVLPLLQSTTPVGDGKIALLWGSNPGDVTPSMGNSVKLVLDATLTGSTANNPASLSLLSPDRNDAPSLAGLTGVPIGLWEVDPTYGDIASADLTVAFNRLLIDEIGGNDKTAMLWTMDYAGAWGEVDPKSFVFDPINETVSGHGDDFDYFAVTIAASAGFNYALVTHPLAVAGGDGTAPDVVSAVGVPEPTIGLLLAAGAIVSLRRRRGDRRNPGLISV